MQKIKVLVFAILCIFTVQSYSALPPDAQVILFQVYQKYKTMQGGKNADYIPELAKVNPAYLGIAIVTVDGKIATIGDTDIPFAIESISKPFVYALALQESGEKLLTEKVGLNATGHSFNSIIAIEEKYNHLQNPLVNAGAIQVTSLIKGKDSAAKWQSVFTFFKKLSDEKIYLGEAIYHSEMATNQLNRAIAELMNAHGMMYADPQDALERYTKACSIMVTAKQLAMMGAILANKGVHPLTHQPLIEPRYVRDVLSQMITNGLYENSGTWWWNIGLPAKSGVGGGLLAVVPGKMAIVVFSPPLDVAGNSVRGEFVIRDLAQQWKLHLLDR